MHVRIKSIQIAQRRNFEANFAVQSGSAHGLHEQRHGLRNAPDFWRIPTTHILTTCLNVRIKPDQIAERVILNACVSAIQFC